MRKRIQQLAGGKFEYARPILSFSTDKVDIEVQEGRDFTGDFVITGVNHVPFRGMIYTSDARMECLTPQFEGEEVRIRYQFHSNGLAEGDIRKGEFYIICNQGEYNLSFVASVSRLYADTSVGKVRNLDDFTALARTSPAEACRLFYSKNFRNILRAEEEWERLLYEGLCEGAATGQKVEEFLVSAGKKKRVTVSLAAEAEAVTAGAAGSMPECGRDAVDVFYDNVNETRRESVRLIKNQWGYVDIKVRSDAAFLVPAKQELTEEDFLGSICTVEYYIEESAMHAGKNFGQISFEIPGQTSGNAELTFSVCATRKDAREIKAFTERREEKEGRVRLLQLYMDYRLKKIVTGAWANQSIEILDHLMALRPESKLYPLMKAQALLINRQRQEAVWIMDDFKRGCTERESPEWGYYLYLCTLVEREPTYVDRKADEIEVLFRKNPDSSLLFWVLLFVRASYYRNTLRRYKAIEVWVGERRRSPYLYLEAYYLIWQDPYLLGRLDQFAVEVLNWAVKQGAVTENIALQVMYIAAEQREFNPLVYKILEACYQVHPEDDMLAVLCGYLIKGQRYETKYHCWYELGIAHELRITGLYEAYLMSLDGARVESVPRMIQMYFQYDSALSYQQKAVLFVNIIASKKRQPEVYQRYRRMIEQFAMEQIEAGHISDDLAVIYDEILRSGVLRAETAQQMTKVLFVHKLTCPTGNIAQALILSTELKDRQVVPLTGGTAYFTAYSDRYCVILCDTSGNRYCKSLPVSDQALMNPDSYMESCLALVPKELSYNLYCLGEGKEECLLRLLGSGQLREEFKASLVAKLLELYMRAGNARLPENGVLETYLEETGTGFLDADTRRKLIELLVEERRYETAYVMVQNDGYDYLGNGASVSLCSYAITMLGFEEDDFLLGFAESTFLSGKYNDVLLIYLCKYYNGATKHMAKLWKAAGEFQIDTFDLEERILTQMLYTTEYTPYAEDIYESYYAGGGREILCLAYLSYFANSYLRQDAVVSRHVFVQIQERYLLDQELNEVCRLGLLKYLAERGKLTARQSEIADKLLAEYTGKNIYFAFYRKFSPELTAKYHLYDKFFLEYHADPGKHILAYFRLGEKDYEPAELPEMYDGIYTRAFVLFFGEEVQYYIVEESGHDQKVVESGCIGNRDVIADKNPGRYVKLNEILLQIALQDMDAGKRQMKKYYGMQRVTEEAFKLL